MEVAYTAYTIYTAYTSQRVACDCVSIYCYMVLKSGAGIWLYDFMGFMRKKWRGWSE